MSDSTIVDMMYSINKFNKKRGIAFFAFALLVLAGCGTKTNTTQNVALAQCLADQWAVFYGAERCPHCANQKRLFGSEAQEYLPYVECDEKLDPQWAQACKLAGVQSFPTWKFANGTVLNGTQNLDALAQAASCTEDVLAQYLNGEGSANDIEDSVSDQDLDTTEEDLELQESHDDSQTEIVNDSSEESNDSSQES